MIYIEQGQTLKNDPTIRVAAPTGDYNETDLLECYRSTDPTATPICMYQAQYIIFGNTIYHQSEELTEDQVAALISGKSPDEVINNRKMIDGKNPAAKYLGQVVKRDGKIGKRQLRDQMSQQDVVADTTVVDEKKKKVKDIVVEENTNTQNTNTQNTDNTASAGNALNNNSNNSNNNSTSINSTATSTATSTNAMATSTESVATSTMPDITATSTDNGLDLDFSTTTPDINIDTSTTTSGSTEPVIDASSTPNVLETIIDTAIDPVGTATTTMKKAVGKLLASSRTRKPRKS